MTWKNETCMNFSKQNYALAQINFQIKLDPKYTLTSLVHP